MENLILKLIDEEEIEQTDIEDALYEMCDREHASCNDACLVYKLNGSEIPNTTNCRYGCDCFKDGCAMFKFIKRAPKDWMII